LAVIERLSRAALGGDVDPRVRPVVAVSFAYAVSFSTFWVYVGVFAVDRLAARPAEVGVLFLLSAPAAGIANYLSGSLSDRFGRKRRSSRAFLPRPRRSAPWPSSAGTPWWGSH